MHVQTHIIHRGDGDPVRHLAAIQSVGTDQDDDRVALVQPLLYLLLRQVANAQLDATL